jgi:hypothetical protein
MAKVDFIHHLPEMKPVVNTLIQISRKFMRYFPMVQAEPSQIAERR